MAIGTASSISPPTLDLSVAVKQVILGSDRTVNSPGAIPHRALLLLEVD
ncbi:MAG: hypothetical protein H0W06_10195 [Chloroflexia bacterium]|nr:hypothetical protein [Chloroflexia bacterium]